MGAVGVTVEDNSAASQTGLMSRALDIPQPDLSCACTKCCIMKGGLSQAAAQLQAHDISLPEVPADVANRPPLVMAAYLNSPGTLVLPIY